MLLSGCGSSQKPSTATGAPQQQDATSWQHLAKFSGHGSEQTESFTSDTGTLRITWEAKARNAPTSASAFKLTIHSAISGRPLAVAVDHKGPGKGTAFVGEDPRVFFAVIDSGDDLDWSFTVEERLH